MRSPNEATAGGVSEFSSISSLYLIELYSSRSFSRETCLINPQVLGSLYYRECLLTRDILLIAFQRWSLPPINITCLLTLTSGDGDLVICHLCFLPKVPQVKKMNPHQANHHMYLLHQNYTFVSNTKISRTIWVTLWDTKKTSSSSLSLVPPRDDRAWPLSGYIPCHGPHSASSFLPHHLASAYLWFCHSDNTPCLLAFTLVLSLIWTPSTSFPCCRDSSFSFMIHHRHPLLQKVTYLTQVWEMMTFPVPSPSYASLYLYIYHTLLTFSHDKLSSLTYF